MENQEVNQVQHAISLFKAGFLCSQALLSTYGVQFGLSREMALKVSAAFGGGISRMGETCGAVTGALMVIGLKHGTSEAEDKAGRERTYAVAREFAQRFSLRCGSVRCKDLLGCDLNVPEEYARAKELKLFETACPQYVQDASEILEELLE